MHAEDYTIFITSMYDFKKLQNLTDELDLMLGWNHS